MYDYASLEELYFSWYLDELYEAGYIAEYEPQPESYVLSPPIFFEYTKQLKTKVKPMVKKLVREHIYTADFSVRWAHKAHSIFYHNITCNADLKQIPFIANNGISIIEIKPAWSKHNMDRVFSLNQRWLYQRHGVFCQKIIIANKKNSLFDKTFAPIKYLLTEKTKRLRKLDYQPRTLNDFLSQK